MSAEQRAVVEACRDELLRLMGDDFIITTRMETWAPVLRVQQRNGGAHYTVCLQYLMDIGLSGFPLVEVARVMPNDGGIDILGAGREMKNAAMIIKRHFEEHHAGPEAADGAGSARIHE